MEEKETPQRIITLEVRREDGTYQEVLPSNQKTLEIEEEATRDEGHLNPLNA